MRWFFYLLILANLALVGWLSWQAQSPQFPPVPVNQNSAQGRLQLLSELPRESLRPIPHRVDTIEVQPAATTETTSVAEITAAEPAAVVENLPTEEPPATCVRISSVAREADIETLMQKLAQSNLTVLEKGEGITERQTYWVVITPYKTDKAAREVAAQLAKAKVRDFLVVRSGEFKNGISLGLFSQRAGAENRLREILALKLSIRKPEIRLRTSPVQSLWVTTRVGDDDSLKTLQRQLAIEGLQSTTVECPP